MPENKTKATNQSAEEFLAAISDEGRRTDAQRLSALMSELTGLPPVMWGSSIVGFGSYHYRYDSGREGDMAAVGFSPRKAGLTVYLVDGVSRHEELLGDLGPHTTGKACLYLKRLDDVDLGVLRRVIRTSYDYLLAHREDMHRAE